MPASGADRRPRLVGWRDALLFALLTVVPLAMGGRGRLNADTKQYLYLDPGGLLDRARSLWDPALGGGTVSHQAIGYLWPMGPYYWLTDAVGIPDWLAQRVWVGGIQLVAALGALALLRHLLPRHPALLVGAGMYGLSPFVLGHVTGQSGLLLPFAAFGWMVLFVVKSVEEGGWRWPAAFALVVTSCGSLNGSSTFFVLLGAVLWVPHAVVVTRTITVREAVGALLRLGSLTLLTQLWWLVAYVVGGSHGLAILDVTENVLTTSASTSAAEVLRGLGYWFFYGRDTLSPWLAGLAPPYLQTGLVLASFAVPTGAFALGGLVRWRSRAYFVALVLVGTVVAVGAFPEPRSPLGTLFERASRESPLVLSLRNTQRATPLVVLGLAGLVAAGGSVLHRRHRRIGIGAICLLAVLIALAMPAHWRSGLIAERFHRRAVPAAWYEAAEHLDQGEGRVLELPGIDFASYRWGHTLDPVLPGLTERDVLFRELVPAGGAAGVSLLGALDRSIQEGTAEPAAIAPVARLLGAADVVVRGDLEYERYRTARPRQVWALLTDPLAALGSATTFGDGVRNQAIASRPLLDEAELGGADGPLPPQVAVLPVPGGGRRALSALPAGAGVVVAGDGEGVVAAAAAGLLDRVRGPLLYDAELAPSELELATGSATRYVLTDTNRKRANRWYSLRENVGATEPVDAGVVLDDPSDARLELVAGAGDDTRSVARWDGASRIWASSYGSRFTLLPEDRPSNAFDGDRRTSWRAGRELGGSERRIGIELPSPVDAGQVTLLPVQGRPGTVTVTRARVVLDGTRRFEVSATPASAWSPEGLRVQLDGEPFRTLEVVVLATTGGKGPVGLAEVSIPGVEVREVVQLPTGLLERLGERVATAPLAVVLSRHRAHPAEVVRADPEPVLIRSFELPAAVSLHLAGTARLHANAEDSLVDEVAGLHGKNGWRASSSQHLAGSLPARAASAFDGDATTAWSTPLVGLTGQSIRLDAGRTVRLDALDVAVVADRRHSSPTRLLVSMDGGPPVEVRLEAPTVGEVGSVQQHRVQLPATLTGRRLSVEIADVRERRVNDWYSERPVALPVAIAEISVPGLPARPVPAGFGAACRSDLLLLDGKPLGVELVGSPAEALRGGTFDLRGCGGQPIELSADRHELRAVPGADTAIDLDRLVFTTDAWQTAATTAPGPAATVRVTGERAGRASGEVTTDGKPFWLVLDQSMNEGWRLEVDGASVAGPVAVDSFAAGWLVSPDGPGRLAVAVRWAPQRLVDLALGVSAIGAALCAAVLVLGRRRSDGREPDEAVWWEPVAPVSPRVVLAVGLASGLLAGIVLHPLAAPAAVLGAGVVIRWTAWGRYVPVALLAVAGAQVAWGQTQEHHPIGLEWAQRYGGAHVAAMLAVLLLAALAVSDLARSRPAPPGGSAAPWRRRRPR